MHFHHVFEIDTALFQGTAPRPDSFNEMIGGDELAAWLHAALVEKGLDCAKPYVTDHGWDFEIRHEGGRYLVVCSCDFETEGEATEWHAVQVAHQKGNPIDPNPVLNLVRSVLEGEPAMTITVDEAKRRR